MNDDSEGSEASTTLRLMADVWGPDVASLHPSFGTCSVWGNANGQVNSRMIGEWFEVDYHPQSFDPSVIFIVGPGLLIDGSAIIARGLESISPKRLSVYSIDPLAEKRVLSTVGMLVADVRRWTGWSDRKTARMLGTTHPTVRRLARNEFSARSSGSIEQLRNIHDLLSRLRPLVSTPTELASLLTRAKIGHATAERLMLSGEFGEAYRASLRAVSGPRPTMLGGKGVPVDAATHPVDSTDRM
jgi:hypothetical protein